MPLKHFTETMLVVLLGIAIMLTGLAVSLLPPIPDGSLPWTILFIITILYPLLLYPFLRVNRADYIFRLLHFFPVAMVLLWLVVELLMLAFAPAAVVLTIITWSGCLFLVAVGFFYVILFCLHVIRRRVPRLSSLLTLLVLFTLAGVTNAQFQWNRQVASLVNGRNLIAWIGSSSSSSQQHSSLPLPKSANPQEEAWRQKLRDAQRMSASGGILAHQSGSIVAQLSSSSVIAEGHHPKRLPSAGMDMSGLILFFVAGYCGALHQRAQKRFVR